MMREIRDRFFTLTELLVCVCILAILSSLLQPMIVHFFSQANSIACKTNLQQLGVATELCLNDNSGFFPNSVLTYNDTTTPWWWDSDWGDYEPFTGDRSDFEARRRWYSKNYLGQYLFNNSDTTNYQEHPIYNCPSASMRSDENGPFEHIFAYEVNHHKDLWARNADISNSKPMKFTNIYDVAEPNTVFSIIDTAQDSWNTQENTPFSLWPEWDSDEGDGHEYGTIPPRPPTPESFWGPIDPPHQDGKKYWRGCIEFRHNDNANTLCVDGHVQSVFNGEIMLKNIEMQTPQ
ncbi:MAG: hypothetical protein HQL32_18280 [Planctomycetes bacterium]|nr:hypothetical protein [Planctomycetota bacterium]